MPLSIQLRQSLPPYTKVQFGIGNSQMAQLQETQDTYKSRIARRKYINDTLAHRSLGGVASDYAEADKPFAPFTTTEEVISALEEALIIKLTKAKELFDKKEPDPNYDMSSAIQYLDSGRLKGKDLPDRIQKALVEALIAKCEMEAAPKK
jgi:hypothetical protein